MSLFTLHQLVQLLLSYYCWAVLGQGVLFLLAGPGRDGNLFYRVIRQINAPVFWVTRLLVPIPLNAIQRGLLAIVLLLLVRLLVFVVSYNLGWIPTSTPAAP